MIRRGKFLARQRHDRRQLHLRESDELMPCSTVYGASSSILTLTGTLVDGAGCIAIGSTVDGGHNIEYPHHTCNFSLPSQNPRLSPLGDHGGPTTDVCAAPRLPGDRCRWGDVPGHGSARGRRARKGLRAISVHTSSYRHPPRFPHQSPRQRRRAVRKQSRLRDPLDRHFGYLRP